MNTDDLSVGSILLGCPDAADSPCFSRSFMSGRIGLLPVRTPLRTVRETPRLTRLKPYFKLLTWCYVAVCDTLCVYAPGFQRRFVRLWQQLLCDGFLFVLH